MLVNVCDAARNYDEARLLDCLSEESMSGAVLRQAMQKLGREGIFNQRTPYNFLIKTLINKDGRLKEYLGLTIHLSGSGWSISGYLIYTPTFAGIERIFRTLNLAIPVFTKLGELDRYIDSLKLGERRAVVVDAAFLKKEEEQSNHAISCFIEVLEDRSNLFINDSCGASRKFYLTTAKKIAVYFSEQDRQGQSGPFCGTFAINDCIAFSTEDKLLEQMVALSAPLKVEGQFSIKKLPNAMQSLVTAKEALEAHLRYSSLVIEE